MARRRLIGGGEIKISPVDQKVERSHISLCDPFGDQ
jgi:hypothetical protein